jgi:regulator of protease activity HflC (stomatin/prohibitin superfamily)
MAAIVCGALIVVPLLIFSGVHQIPEGHIGVYFRGGAIIDGTTEPGWHFMVPGLTSFEAV